MNLYSNLLLLVNMLSNVTSANRGRCIRSEYPEVTKSVPSCLVGVYLDLTAVDSH
jgi:hypothetical protein